MKKISFVPLNRLMDSLGVLFGVSVLTFLLIRLNITIDKFQPLLPLSIFIFGLATLSYRPIRSRFWQFGLIAFLFIIFTPLVQIFPSIKDPNQSFLEIIWRQILWPIIWIISLIAYATRSYLTDKKVLLNCFGFIFLLTSFFIGFGNLLEKSKINISISLKPPIVLKAGDPLADLRLNPSIKPEALEREEKRLGLKENLFKQYLLWLDGILLRGDFGLTQQGEPVIQAIQKPLRNTLILNILVLFFTWLISLPLGILASLKKNSILDKLILTFSSLSLTTPSFLLTIFILALAVKLGFGQIGGLTSINFNEFNLLGKLGDLASHLFWPVFILTFVSLGGLIRQMRGNLLDVLNEDYIKAARARSIPEPTILWNNALQNAINPLITLLGFEFAALVSGAALTEMILAYPGIGALTLEAAKRLDINLIMFNLLLGTIMLMTGNALADLLLEKVDPRTKKQ